MTEVTALSLDEFAALSAKMEAGVGREQALAQAELSPESWTEAQRTWLDRMATLATQGQPALLQRFLQQLNEHRHAQALGARDTEIGPEDDLPCAPSERIAPLMGRTRSAGKSAPPPAVVGGPRPAAPAAAPAQARPPSSPPAASPWANSPGAPAPAPAPQAAPPSPAAPVAKPPTAARSSPTRAAKPRTAAMRAAPAAAAELPFRRIESQPPPAAVSPPGAETGRADGALPFRKSSRPPAARSQPPPAYGSVPPPGPTGGSTPPAAPSQPPPAPAPQQPADLGSTVWLDAIEPPAIPKAPAGPVDLSSTVCLDSPEQAPAPQPNAPAFMRAPAAPAPGRPAVRPPVPGPAKTPDQLGKTAPLSRATPKPAPGPVDLFSTVAVNDPDALAIEAAAALPFKDSGPSAVPSTGSGGLPFKPAQAGPARPAPKKSGSIPPPAGATITDDEPEAVHAPGQPAGSQGRGPTLPFGRGFKPAPAGATAPPQATSASDRSALPFDEAWRKAQRAVGPRPSPSAQADAAAKPPAANKAPAKPPPPEPKPAASPSPSSAVAPMTLKQYAWLSANLEKAPTRARQTLTMLGLTEQSKEHIERYWNGEFERNPAKRAEFERMRAKHLDSDG